MWRPSVDGCHEDSELHPSPTRLQEILPCALTRTFCLGAPRTIGNLQTFSGIQKHHEFKILAIGGWQRGPLGCSVGIGCVGEGCNSKSSWQPSTDGRHIGINMRQRVIGVL
jgi:hypothetical protein